MKILIAEDDTVSRFVLQVKLEKSGHTVIPAVDGREGWQLYQSDVPDVIITDWMMPNIDGLELTRMIRADKRPAYAYIIILTALGGKGSFLEGMQAGADDFMTKPFDADSLDARLKVAERMLLLQEEVIQLRGLLSVCPDCKRIQNGDGGWETVQEYVARSTSAVLSSGKCPSCASSPAAGGGAAEI